jgi:hypothetical protein
MSLPYTPRQKGTTVPLMPMKTVRIDARTQIIVPVSRSDEEAISRFNARYETYRNYAGQGTPHIPNTPNEPIRNEFKEIPMGTVEELAALIDDSVLPETE